MDKMRPKKARIEKPYNPLEKKNIGVSVADALLGRPMNSLPPEERFVGAGIYAIYYSGDFKLYKNYGEAGGEGNSEIPIYVGKAIPPGARKGGFGLELSPGQALFNRLVEHAKSIEQVKNLKLKDFSCRFLVVDDIWIPLGESLLVEMFHPLWNISVDGFGNHDPGKGRYKQKISAWDTLHPGRSWVSRLQPSERKYDEIVESVNSHLEKYY